jgi:chromosome partitioning protein
MSATVLTKRTNIVTISNQKGGVGKTTTALCLAEYLANSGYRVLLVDLDAQMNLTEWVTARNAEVPRATMYTSLRAEEPTPIEQSIVPTIIPHVDLVYGDRKLGMIDPILAELNRPLRRLRSILRNSATVMGYDYVLIDSPPGVSRLLLNALVVADQLILPCTASAMALKGLKRVIDDVDRLSQGEDREIEFEMPMRVVFTKFNPNTKISKAAMKRVTDRFGLVPFVTHVRTSIRAEEAPDFHQTLGTYDPKNPALEDYARVGAELIDG